MYVLNYGTYAYIVSVCCNHGSVTTLVVICSTTSKVVTFFWYYIWRAIFSSKCKGGVTLTS